MTLHFNGGLLHTTEREIEFPEVRSISFGKLRSNTYICNKDTYHDHQTHFNP